MIKVALAQVKPVLGDFVGNAHCILSQAKLAVQQDAQVLVLPELALTGCPALDLLRRPAFIQQAEQMFQALCEELTQFNKLAVLVGHIVQRDGLLFNAASVIVAGEVIQTSLQQRVTDAQDLLRQGRYFKRGQGPVYFEHDGLRFGLTLGYDTWHERTAQQMRDMKVAAWFALEATVFQSGTFDKKTQELRDYAHIAQAPLIQVNRAGAQGELVFEGASSVLTVQGEAFSLPFFEPCTGFVGLHKPSQTAAAVSLGQILNATQNASDLTWQTWDAEDASDTDLTLSRIWQALVVSVRDYVHDSGFQNVLLGLSGGMDSALVLAIAVDALGADHVMTVMMPSDYTSDISLEDASAMAQGLNVRYEIIPIRAMTDAFETALAPIFSGHGEDLTEENIQARTRGNILMSISNKLGSLVLSTGNKSELSAGYCTLYGDMVGAYAVLQDVPKTVVYQLAAWRNRQSHVIPTRIITRPPSAELRENQTDQDSLPEYDMIDAVIEGYVNEDLSVSDLQARGLDAGAIEQMTRLIRIGEYKRRQAAPGPKITTRSFSWDWHYPMTHAFRETNDEITEIRRRLHEMDSTDSN